MVRRDLEMPGLDRFTMDKSVQPEVTRLCHVRLEVLARKVEAPEQQDLHVLLPVVSQLDVSRTAAGIILAFSSRVIVIKMRRQPEALERAGHIITDNHELKDQAVANPGQASGVRLRAIHRSHRHGQVLPPAVHLRQEVMAAAAVKAAVQVDLVDEKKITWSKKSYEYVSQNIWNDRFDDDGVPGSARECSVC